VTTFGQTDDLQGAQFVRANLRNTRFEYSTLQGARFVESDLSEIVMRGVDISRADIDAPWLPHGDYFLVNGVDVIAYVEAELDRRFPGRELRRADTPEGLRAAWDALERTWAATVELVAAMPAASVDISVDGEWSFAQTLRHLVLATDAWLGRAVLGIEQPFHRVGIGDGNEGDALGTSVFMTEKPSYDEVLAARADCMAMVRSYIAAVSPDELTTRRKPPWSQEFAETTLGCLHVILEEEWEHHRFAARDLEALSARASG
jgi:hypothetical protein